MSVSKKLYDSKEAASQLSISVKTIRSLTKRGLLKSNRAVRKLLYTEAELTRFAEGK